MLGGVGSESNFKFQSRALTEPGTAAKATGETLDGGGGAWEGRIYS